MSVAVSIREQALQQTIVLLAAAGSPAMSCSRSQLDQIEIESLPLFDVTPGDQKVEDPGEYGDRTSVTNTLSIAVRAMVNAEQAGDSALDSFYVFAVQQLCGDGADFAGLVDEVVEQGSATVFQPNGRNIIGLEMHFDLKFATKRGDPTQRG